MKLKAIILLSIAAVLLSACFPLLSPMRDRINPYDESSILPLATGLTVVYDGTPGITPLVRVSWTPVEIGDGQTRHGYLLIRKAGSAPTSIFDGTLASIFDSMESEYVEYIDDGIDGDYDEGIQGGYVYYYGLFAFYTEEEDPPAVNNTDEYGNLTDTEYYIFSGPLVASDEVPAILQLDIVLDTYIDNVNFWYDDTYDLQVGYDGSNPTKASVIQFDTDPIDGATILGASLSLNNRDDYTGNWPTVNMIIDDWSTSTSFIDITSDNWGSTTYGFTFNVTNTTGGNYNTDSSSELFEILQQWASGADNYGLRIMIKSGAVATDEGFNSSESGVDNYPILEVTYIHE